jgi:hypothetical protein
MREPSTLPKAVFDEAESETVKLANLDGFIHQEIIAFDNSGVLFPASILPIIS